MSRTRLSRGSLRPPIGARKQSPGLVQPPPLSRSIRERPAIRLLRMFNFFISQTKIHSRRANELDLRNLVTRFLSSKIGDKLRNVKTLGIWLLALLLAVTCAIPNAIAPSGTTKGDAARAAFNLPLRTGRRPSRALPFEENLRSLSLQEESAPRGSFGRVLNARLRRISPSSSRAFLSATETSFPPSRLCRLRI